MLPLPAPPAEQPLDQLLARTEAEWRALQTQRSQLREAALQEAHGRLEEAQGRLRLLQEDFVYNLQLLEERDRELERYDCALAQAQRLEEARQAEVSELQIQVAKLRRALAQEARQREDLQQQQQRREQEHRLELQRVHSEKNSELDQQRDQYRELKGTLERKLEELDGALALQRQELLLELESEMQKQEQEFRLHSDSMSGEVLAHELKVKLLNKELEALREARAQATESLQSAQAVTSELEGRLQHAAWELRDLAAVKDARIKELEDKLESVQLTRRTEEETFSRKHEELDRAAREREAVLASVKAAHMEQLRALEARVLELQAQGEARELQARRAEWRQADALKEKDATINKLREEAAALRSDWDAQVAQLSREMTSKDLQVQSLQEEEAELKGQLARCQQDIGRYQRQLSLAMEREQSLERDKVQLGLDWQRRCAGLERGHYRRSEELVQALAAAREQAAARLQEAERKLCDQEVVLKAVTLERDQALQALRSHGLAEQGVQGLLGHHGEETDRSFPSGEIRRLQEQNSALRGAVAQMRTEMDALNEQVLPPAQPGGGATTAATPAPVPDDVRALEAEIRNLKSKFKTLEEQLGGGLEPLKKPPPASDSDVPPSVCPAAEATGGAVPADDTSAGTALWRLGDRASRLNLLVARLRHEVLQGPLEPDAVRCGLPLEVAQVHLEVLELQRQAAELEKHLRTALQAGREPPGGPQPPQPKPVDLRTQDPAAGGPAGSAGPGAQPPQAEAVLQLQRKLKESGRTVLRLRREKEQLLELGNRLRAELGRAAGKLCHPSPSPEAQNPGEGPGTPWERGPPLKPRQPLVTAQGPKDSKGSGKAQPHVAPTAGRHAAPGGTAAGTGGQQRKLSTVTCTSAHQKENQSPKPRPARGRRQGSGHHSPRSSSPASSSLQDTWKLLDLGSSPSGLASQDDSTPVELTAPTTADSRRHPAGGPTDTRAAFAVRGVKMDAQAKARPTRARPARPKGCQRPPRIRNYNVKD